MEAPVEVFTFGRVRYIRGFNHKSKSVRYVAETQPQTPQTPQSFLIPLDKVIKKLRRSRYVQELFLAMLESNPPVRKWRNGRHLALWRYVPYSLEKYALVHYHKLLEACIIEEFTAVNPETGRRVIYIRWDPELVKGIIRAAVKPGEDPVSVVRGMRISARDAVEKKLREICGRE